MPRSASDIVRLFIDRINGRDADAMAELMTGDHRFVDSLGAAVEGRDAARKAWVAYFNVVPDYAIRADETFRSGDVVVVLGAASGTCSEDGRLLEKNRWETPAAWRAVVRAGRIAEWRVYADNEPVRAILRAGAAGRA